MNGSPTWKELASNLTDALELSVEPMAITFVEDPPVGVPRFDMPMSERTTDGRSGRVPASCVFWVHGDTKTFVTMPEDHGNCSVGMLVHGFADLEDIAGKSDVDALLGSGWVTTDAVGHIPRVSGTPSSIVYGPLADSPIDPDVVLLRLNPKQMMELADATPEIQIAGKPQCHIIARAKEDGQIAASMGCALSRVRTGMLEDEMTCAIPAGKLPDVVKKLHRTINIDRTVEAYAATDLDRFR